MANPPQEKVRLMVGWSEIKIKIKYMMGESNLNVALHTPVEALTDEQKQLIRESVGALSDSEKERFTEAGILSADAPAAPEKGDSEGGSAEGEATTPDGGDQSADAPATETDQPSAE
jgi:hypothetical protein